MDHLDIAEITGTLVSILSGDDDGAKEQLKPHNMACASPRVFWGIVRHFGGPTHQPVSVKHVQKSVQNLYLATSAWNIAVPVY